MNRPPALLAAAAVLVLAGLAIPSVALGQGAGVVFRFLFTPQAGYYSAGLSCGWHAHACTGPTPEPGPALDWPASSADTGDNVYFRYIGIKPSGAPEQVAFASPDTVPDDEAVCKTTRVTIRDEDTQAILGYMFYTHTYLTSPYDMQMSVSPPTSVTSVHFAEMVQTENQDCPWGGVHLHESSASHDDVIYLRDGGGCGGAKYPCAPGTGGPYHPQEYDDWARTFCFDDTDCDGWTEDQESYLGTDPVDDCPNSSSHAAWPLDINNDRYITVSGDISNYSGRLGAQPGWPNWWQRLDLNADGYITVSGDVSKYAGKLGQTCYN